jgi:Hyphally regulated cell wall protein N-terminal
MLTAGGSLGGTTSGGGTLDLAGSTTFDGLGKWVVDTALINESTVLAESGLLSFLGSVTNDGTIGAASATSGSNGLLFADRVAGEGLITIGDNGAATFNDGCGAQQTVVFQSPNAALGLLHPLDFRGAISGFGLDDQIDLLKTAADQVLYSQGILTVSDNGGAVARLDILGSYDTNNFHLQTDFHGGSLITYTTG